MCIVGEEPSESAPRKQLHIRENICGSKCRNEQEIAKFSIRHNFGVRETMLCSTQTKSVKRSNAELIFEHTDHRASPAAFSHITHIPTRHASSYSSISNAINSFPLFPPSPLNRIPTSSCLHRLPSHGDTSPYQSPPPPPPLHRLPHLIISPSGLPPAPLSHTMTSVANQQQQQPQQDDVNATAVGTEPPTKKRRGGRRTSNPEISAEERKRLRILKNRESAMRSLAKKAEYSAKLEALEKRAIDECSSTRDSLEQLIATAIALKADLDKASQPNTDLIVRAETCISSATDALADDTDQSLISTARPATIAATTEQGIQPEMQGEGQLTPNAESTHTIPTSSATETQSAIAAPEAQSAIDSDLIMSNPNTSNAISPVPPATAATHLAGPVAISMPPHPEVHPGTADEEAGSK